MRKEILDLIYREPVKIGHWLGFRDLTDLHNTWIQEYLFGEGDITTQAHRGSYKTTTFSLAAALDLGIAPKKNTIMLRKTDSDVSEVIAQVGAIISTPLYHKIMFDLYGQELQVLKRSTSEVNTNLANTTKGRPQLLGIGIKGSLTGKHADKVVTDDIVNLRDRISTAEREYTKAVYMELENIRNRGGRILNYGTPWHKQDAFTLMPNLTCHDCYSTGLMTPEQIETLRSRMTRSLFAANYELKHVADDKALFGDPQYINPEDRDLIYDGIGHIDAAYGGEDSTAFTIMKKHTVTEMEVDQEKLAVTGDLPASTHTVKRDYLITLGKLWDKHVDDCVQEILELARLYRCGTIHMERNADKGYLSKEMRRLGSITKSYQESTNKYVKIATYGKQYWPDVRFLQATDDEYISQVMDYQENALHDDAPDSLASIIRVIHGRQATVNLYTGGI